MSGFNWLPILEFLQGRKIKVAHLNSFGYIDQQHKTWVEVENQIMKQKITKEEMMAAFAENLSLIDKNYEAYLNEDGQIQHKSSMIIKSTLNGKPAMSDGFFVGVNFPSVELFAQLPEWQAEYWHEHYKSFDILLEQNKPPYKQIKPLLFDSFNTVVFNNGVAIQRSYFDLFWVKHRNDGLLFKQPESGGAIIIEADNEIVGIIQPVHWDKQDDDFKACLKEFIKNFGH